ncbi:hypothetical protein MJO29_004229 [Puccinia striiformis f. sp. tritici]|nr:hypothetical protein MJO29_004229 [Puccinia striiformis f. sp. tritici]
MELNADSGISPSLTEELLSAIQVSKDDHPSATLMSWVLIFAYLQDMLQPSTLSGQLGIGKSTHAPLRGSAALALLSMENGLMSSFETCLDSIFHPETYPSSCLHALSSASDGAVADTILVGRLSKQTAFD